MAVPVPSAFLIRLCSRQVCVPLCYVFLVYRLQMSTERQNALGIIISINPVYYGSAYGLAKNGAPLCQALHDTEEQTAPALKS